MDALQRVLFEAAASPRMTAVRYSQIHKTVLMAENKITKQELRQLAVLIDAQAKEGVRAEPVKVEKAKTVSKKAPKVKLAKAPVEKKAAAKAKPKVKSKKKS
jgi:hypothetical protein